VIAKGAIGSLYFFRENSSKIPPELKFERDSDQSGTFFTIQFLKGKPLSKAAVLLSIQFLKGKPLSKAAVLLTIQFLKGKPLEVQSRDKHVNGGINVSTPDRKTFGNI
jgi:hypothetical protein